MLFYYITHDPGNELLGFESLVVTNLLYFYCAHVQFNNVHFLFGVIFKKCTLCNLITLANMVACLRIVVEGYFSHSITMKSCITSPPC